MSNRSKKYMLVFHVKYQTRETVFYRISKHREGNGNVLRLSQAVDMSFQSN